MSDREALAAALDVWDHRLDAQSSGEWFDAMPVWVAAARERLAQLPEKCDVCDGTGEVIHDGIHHDQCAKCRDGKVYPAETVERIERIIADAARRRRSEVGPGSYDRHAVAVLDALNGETA